MDLSFNMPILNLNYGYKVTKSGRRVYQVLLLCVKCNKTRVINKDSIYSKRAGIDCCYKCSRKDLIDRNKNKVWSQEVRLRMSQNKSGDKSPIWNSDRQEIKQKIRFRNKSYSKLRFALMTPHHTKTINNTIKQLGYTPQELRKHLESTWESWMNWGNYGKPKFIGQRVWTIDHIEGLEKFYYLGINDLKIINALSNLRSLESSKNCGFPAWSKMIKKSLLNKPFAS